MGRLNSAHKEGAMKKSTKKAKAATKAKKTPSATPKRSKAARAHIAEGTRLFALAGRPTKAQFAPRTCANYKFIHYISK